MPYEVKVKFTVHDVKANLIMKHTKSVTVTVKAVATVPAVAVLCYSKRNFLPF